MGPFVAPGPHPTPPGDGEGGTLVRPRKRPQTAAANNATSYRDHGHFRKVQPLEAVPLCGPADTHSSSEPAAQGPRARKGRVAR